jgi:two-component system KDP operon response regulator KdpE
VTDAAIAATEPGARPTIPGPVIAVIEDEAQIRRFLRATLVNQGYRCFEATTGAEGLAIALSRQPDLVLLDLALPDLDGIEVIRRLREWTAVPIIVLSARGEEQVKIAAIDMGADDYVTKPFGVGELLARIRAAFRHAGQGPDSRADPVVTRDALRVDLAQRRVFVHDAEVRLTPTEYRLLATLVRHAGKVLTHRQLLKEVWGPHLVDQPHYLRVYMLQLRRKLEIDPARPKLLLTEPGVGYRFAD